MSTTIFSLDTWKRFVKEGVLDSARLNKRIMESWYRCKTDNVNPYLKKGMQLLTSDQLTIQKQRNSLLMEIASPHIKMMSQAIKDSGMMALLVDPDGYVLSLLGNERTLRNARKINFVEGVRWTECEVGTNAIGTALKAGEAVVITGAEHYSVASHNWSCSATPIFNEKGSLMGVIDVSCPVENSHPFMLGMVTSIAYAIERELHRRNHQQEIALIHQAADLVEAHRNRPFIVCNLEQLIILASKTIRDKLPQSIGMNLDEFLRNGYQITIETAILSKEDDNIIGKCLFLSEMLSYHKNSLFVSSMSAQSLVFKGERGISEAFQSTLRNVELVAPTDATVFITGETGTGKELVARAVHENSPRRNGPFISLNCGAIPKNLMESELFGYVEGAFTGAKRQGFKGKFEQAHKGTIFLDEIGEISQTMQVALLRVLQERKVIPIGGMKEIPVDIRIITATHSDINELVSEGTFRQDLYYRLNVYPIDVPPLRKRNEDIPLLIQFFCQRNNWNIPFTDEFLKRLREYHWPGNIRELMNMLERLHILTSNDQFGQEKLSSFQINLLSSLLAIEQVEVKDTEKKLKTREKIQRDVMLDALQKTYGNVTAAAKLLEIPRSTFYKRLQRFGI